MKYLVILTVTYVTFLLELSNGSCLRGKASFLLTANVDWNGLPSPYEKHSALNVSECVQRCRTDDRCRLALFQRNSSAPSRCHLLEGVAYRAHLGEQIPQIKKTSGLLSFEKVCLAGACLDRLFVMEQIPHVELEGHDNLMVPNVTRLQCLELCLGEKTFACRSAEHDSSKGECRLSRYDRFSRHTHFQKAQSQDVSYFDNSCAYQPVSEGNTAEILLLGNVEHPYSLVEYRDVSVSECGDLCLKSPLFPCRSFLFGRRSGQPFCGLTHQNRAGLFQSPGSFRPSSHLNYYEIARNLDACDAVDVHFEMLSGSVLDVSPYKTASELSPGQCLSVCRAEAMCRSVNVDYRKGTCQFNADSLRSGPDAVLRDMDNFNYFEKICLPGGTDCGHRDWAFERVRGKELPSSDDADDVRVDATTREECQASCLKQGNGHLGELLVGGCRSLRFDQQTKDCRLSSKSRFTSLDKKVDLKGSKFVVDYFESNCFKEPRTFCNTKSLKRHSLSSPDEQLILDSIDLCREACLSLEAGFTCRSFSYDEATRLCSLSHHTRKSAPRGTMIKADTSEYREITTCFHVGVDCGQDVMRAHVKSNTIFSGKVYTKPNPNDCILDITNKLDFTLPILLSGCGTEREEEGKFSNILMIQGNDQVVTASDKAVGVYCTYDLSNKTEEVQLNITTIESSEESRSSPSMPQVSMHILDVRGKEKDSVSLGELLRVQLRMSEEDTYGIFVRNLIAKDGTGANNLTLIDNSGCPLEVKMMREIRTLNPRSKSLESYLEAFTFTGSSTLELEAEVETCRENCRPVLCQIPTGRSEDDLETVSSFGKRRRRRSSLEDQGNPVLTRTMLSKTLSVQAEDFGLMGPLQKNFAFPVTAPTITKERRLDDPFLRWSIGLDGSVSNEDDVFCFDPMTSVAVGGAVLFLEVFLFVMCVLVSHRWKKGDAGPDSKQPLSIYYENSSDMTTG